MPVMIRVMSWNIQKKKKNAPYIAALMQTHQIDICVLLEVPRADSFSTPMKIVTELSNLNPSYFQHQWRFKSVEVGSECVSYIWHETVNAGVNAFRAETYANSGAVIAGPVFKDNNDATIYFPTTKFKWASLPGRPAGRRPAFMSFVTNDGAPARRFTVLDLHTPFNTATSIQSYAAHVYATSREIQAVDAIDAFTAASTASTGLAAALAVSVDPLLAGLNYAPGLQLRKATVAAALKAIEDGIQAEGADLQRLFTEAINEGINAAVNAIGAIPPQITTQSACNLSKGCAMASVVASTTMIASIRLPTAPGAATAGVPNAAAYAQAQVTAQGSMYSHPAKRAPTRLRDAIRTEAKRMAKAAVTALVFPAMPRNTVDVSIVAGDFNVDFPDNTVYTMQQLNVLGGGNAYTRLVANTNGGARNAARTTRIGPTAFYGQRVYTLKNPCPVQWTNAKAADYVPLNLTPLANNSYIGNAAWTSGLKTQAQLQNVVWAKLLQPPYADRLLSAFDLEVLDDSTFYRANCYDNIFVRGGAVGASGTLDVMSELGSWPARTAALPNPQPALAPNPWAAALGTLNPIAQAQLNPPNTRLSFTYSGNTFQITPQLADAEDAAVFFDQFISDHLPVFVRVQI